MTQIIWSRAAQRELEEINSWYAQVDPQLPLTLTGRVDAALARLIDFPHIGSPVPDSTVRKWRARQTPYLIFYRPTRDGLRILKVRHARSNRQAEE